MNRLKTSVIYDLDGTIADTEKFHLEAWAVTGRKYGLPASPLEIHSASLGTSTLSTLKVLFPDLGESHRAEIAAFKFASLISLIENSNVQLMSGFYETWKCLVSKGINLGICSAARTENIMALKKSGGEISEVLASLDGKIVSKEMCSRGKPSPEPLLMTVGLVGATRAEEVLYVGDAPADQECALRAGIDYLHFGSLPAPMSPSMIIQDHRELLGILKVAC